MIIKKCIGLYNADQTGERYGWKSNENEMYEDLVYSAQGKNIDGVSIYKFETLRRLYDDKDTYSAIHVKNGIKVWNITVLQLKLNLLQK